MSAKKKKVTIAVITYKRPKSLARLIESLKNQTLISSPGKYRVNILIVDNDGTGENKKVIDKAKADSPFPIKMVTEKNKGLSFARQKAIKETKKEDALIFIDDDEVAGPDWLDSFLKTWTLLGVHVLAGPVTAIMPAKSPAWATSLIYSHDRTGETGYLTHHAYTNNSLVSREAIDAVDPAFPPEFNTTGCEDTYFYMRLAQLGYPSVFCKEARVFEFVPESRVKLSWLLQRSYRIGSCQTMINKQLFGIPRATILLLGHSSINLLRCIKQVALGCLFCQTNRIATGFRHFSATAGMIAGYFNLTYKEYDTTHGE
jgi:glycosyltransferase involved in cell wall biosynthesis